MVTAAMGGVRDDESRNTPALFIEVEYDVGDAGLRWDQFGIPSLEGEGLV